MSASAPSSYPGNPALPREVREKILSTFRHTLNLYQNGKLDDCLIGCDFILKMDPRFSPARQLLDKAKNPQAAVDVKQLEALVSETPTRQDRVAAAQPDRLLVRAVESFNARDFDAAIAAADEVLAALPGNRDAREIRDNALRKKEAQPKFESSRQRALAALEAGRKEEARGELDRMRQLDADHPAVALLERRIGTAEKPVVGGPDLSRPGGGLSGATSEPELAFDGDSTNPAGHAAAPEEPAGGLDSLSLDSLSLEEPPEPPRPAAPPPPDRGRVSAAPPGSPGDLWSGGMTEEPGLDLGVSPDLPSEDSEPASTQLEIELLLRQGDEAAARGDRQQAIEIWSRIFLIDINNTEAVLRIEKARQDMAEGNRRISEGLRQGKEQYEARDLAAARVTFLEVLANDENEPTARSYLDRIEQELAQPAAPEDLAQTVRADVLAEELAEAVPAPPPPLVEREKAARGPRAGIRPRLLLLVGVFAVLVAGGVFLVLHMPDKSATPAQDVNAPSLERATLLFREGKLPETLAELRRIPAEHPDYLRAQKLLASLTRPGPAAPEGAPAGEAAPPEAASDSAPAPEANEPARIRAEAERALAEKRYITALKGFNQAAPAFQGDPTFAKEMGTAAEKVTELTPAVKLYNEGEYESAIPILWRIYQADRQNRDARDYLLRSYHNQGVGHLQNGLYGKAREAFDEILAVDPGDPEAARHRKFAERYVKGDLDLLGRIYVRHLQQRP